MSSEARSYVATLMAAEPDLATSALLAEVRTLLPENEVRWLDGGRVADIFFSSSARDVLDLKQSIAHRCGGAGAHDVIVQPVACRRKKLLLADMDSTIIGQECIDELADFAGLKPQVSALTERAMRGELAFEPALRERVALLKDLPLSVIDSVLRDRISLTAGSGTLVATMQANGAYCALVSGGFTLFTAVISTRLGFDEHRGNDLVVEGGRLAGMVRDPIVGREAKLAALIEIRDGRTVAPEETMAVGDGANDLAMIAEAGLGVAFHAKPAVAAAAAARIDHNDLTALLYCQGYHRDEFVPH